MFFGYFGDAPAAETADHVNLVWIMFDPDPVAEAMRAKIAGIDHIVLAVCWRCGQGYLRLLFTAMRNANVLDRVIALYPEDEPDLTMTEQEVIAMAALVRGVAAEYPELARIQLWAIYSASGNTPGISQFDSIGRDAYGSGPQFLGDNRQRIILVPGGANPWRESSDAYLSAANDPRVIAIIPFLWRYPNPGQGVGIADNGLAPAYRAAGRAVTGR